MRIGLECLSPAMLNDLQVRGDSFWLHLDDKESFNRAVTHITSASISPNLRCFFVSGFGSEDIHDSIDDLIERNISNYDVVLTVWSHDEFSEALWEFIEVHSAHTYIEDVFIMILSGKQSRKRDLLSELINSPQFL